MPVSAAPPSTPAPTDPSARAPAHPCAPLRVAIIGAGPVGLALALLLSRDLPDGEIHLFDARAWDADGSGDPRAVALSLGSLHLLESLQCWPIDGAAAIRTVEVSQDAAWPSPGGGQPTVRIHAPDLQVPQLGAVLAYGTLVPRLQRAWGEQVLAHPTRCWTRFGQAVSGLKTHPSDRGGGVEVDAGIAERFDLAIVAEGGVFQQQPALHGTGRRWEHDYGQTAWVGTVRVADAREGVAIERFTRGGPVALLPLPSPQGQPVRHSLVWCTDRRHDPIGDWSAEQRLAVLNSLLPSGCGTLVDISPLKAFSLGLSAAPTLVQDDCVVRIGNAAQTLHPVAGQGLNLGFRDALALAEQLRLRPRRKASLAQALQAVQWARTADRWATIATTDFLARSFTWDAPVVASARALGLWAVEQLPGLKSALARQMMFGRR